MDKTLVIHKKKQTLLIVIGVLILVAASGIALGALTSFVFPQLPGFSRLKVTAVVTIVTVVITGLYIILRTALSRKPGLIIDERGITDHSNITSVGFIPWREITGVKEAQNAFGQKMIIVLVSNPDQYIYQTRWLRDARQMQDRQFGSPIVIAASKLAYDPQALLTLLEERVRKKSQRRFTTT